MERPEGAGAPGLTSRRRFLIGAVAVPVTAGAAAYLGLLTARDDPATGATRKRAFEPRGSTGQAVQRAIDEAYRTGGGVVPLSTGTYTTDAPILVRDNVMLTGRGPASRVKAGRGFLRHPGPHGGHPLITTDGADDVTISDLVADQSGDTLDGDVAGRLREHLVDGRYSTNLLISGVRTRNPFSYSIAVIGSARFRVQGCRTSVTSRGRYDQLDGIHVLGSRAGDVVDNQVDQGGPGADGDDGLVAHSINDPCHAIVYRNNRVRGGRHGAAMQLAVGRAPVHDIVIRNNTFYGSPIGLHARYYAEGAWVRDIVVGGSSLAGNVFSDNASSAVDFTAGRVENTVVSYNTSVESGDFLVPRGSGNMLHDNVVD